MGALLDTLRKQDKKGILKQNISSIGYPTGLLPLDFRNGYQVNVSDKDGNIVKHWANVGLFSGSFVSITGKPGTAKTAFCVQVASEICRNYKNSEIFHLDLEVSSNISRLMKLSHYTPQEMEDKYHYFNNYPFIEDIFELIWNICETKLATKEEFVDQTGKVDEFGVPVVGLVPTVVIIDSLPMIQTKEIEGMSTMAGQTYDMRRVRAFAQFYRRLRPMIQRANVIVMVINHLTDNPAATGMVKTQSQIMYLKQSESVPGGQTPLYLAQTFLKFVQCGKYNFEKDGFDGFMVRCEFIKSKTNFGGTSCELIYDMDIGFDPHRTLMNLITNNNLIGGRNPYSYFLSNPNAKFDTRKFKELCVENPALYKEAMVTAAPILYKYLSNSSDLKKIEMQNEEFEKEILHRLNM